MKDKTDSLTSKTRVWEFDRYVDGRLKAEGVRVSRAATFEEACRSAVSMASPGSVLVLRQPSETPAFGTCSKCQQPIDSFHNINGCPSEKASEPPPLSSNGLPIGVLDLNNPERTAAAVILERCAENGRTEDGK